MLRLTLARDKLLCAYGDQLDPSKKLEDSGALSPGCRPSIFFGPQRDALHLITKKLQAALVIRPRILNDLEARLYVLALPGGCSERSELWQRQTLELGQQILPKLSFGVFEQTKSQLESNADLYHQEFTPRCELWPEALCHLRLSISAGIFDNALRESWQIKGFDSAQFQAVLVYAYEPEIAASQNFQSTLFYEKAESLSSFRGSVNFSLQAFHSKKFLPLAFADCGARQQELAANRFADILRSFWAQDELLGLSYVAQHKTTQSWLPLEAKSFAALGQTDGIICWHVPGDESFELRFRLTETLDELLDEMPLLETSFERLRKDDQAWLAQLKPVPSHVQGSLKESYERTLLTLRQMQDPGGGIIAAPEFHYDLTHCGGYGYCWGRDAGFISYAMDIAGMHDESARFYRYMQRCQSEDGSFLHRHDMQGSLGASWGLLQPDETASVIFGLWQHVLLAKNSRLALELQSMIHKAGDWLATARHPTDPELPIPGHDLWEEREGVHYYSVAAMTAGLRAAVQLYKAIDLSIPETWNRRLSELLALCNSPRFIQKRDGQSWFARSLKRRISSQQRNQIEQHFGEKIESYRSTSGQTIYTLEQDFVVDVSLLAAVYPFHVLDLKQHEKAYDHLLESVMKRLWRPKTGGIGRYEADYYRDGNPWVLSTLWLALAAVCQSEESNAPVRASNIQLARTAWTWVLRHMPEEGQLPEQIDPVNGRASWVMPLTWSHAMFALAVQQLPKEVLQ